MTVLFADLAGYTALCETRDPEQVHLLVRPLMNALRGLCEQRGGTVPGIQGDGFMAVFGAHTSQEDEPARALDAAVHLQRSVEARRAILPEIPELRIGVHTGDVLVAASWESAGLSVSGDAVNVASRVCSAAAPGEVVVTSEAVDLIRATTGWTPERELQLRGRGASVRVRAFDWRGVSDVVRGPRWSAASPYVSRTALETALDEGLAAGRGVLVVGDAGMGKSRLVHHVLGRRRVITAAGATALRPSASGLFADLLEQLPTPQPDLLRLLRGAGSGGLADESLLLRSAAAHLREAAPDATLFVDDLELLSADEARLLLAAMQGAGGPFVVASRQAYPELALHEVRVPAWSSHEAAELLEQTLPLASAELRHAVLDRAGDCPLYLEQVSQLLLDNGAVQVDAQGSRVIDPVRLSEIPRSMRLFVSSRLDLLPPAQRAVLGVASVLGPEPDLALLRHLAGEDCELVEPLVQRGFLRWHAGQLEQPALRFSHALVRDVAYETQLRSRRVEIHRAAAEWYAVLPVSQVLESQAYHLEAAVRLEEPDCELLRRTVEAMVLFARSIEEERSRVAKDVLSRARALIASRPECGCDMLQLELSSAAVHMHGGEEDESRQAAERALQLAAERNDPLKLAEAHLHRARTYRFVDGAAASADLEVALAGFEGAGDRAGVARVALERAILSEHQTGLVPFLGHLEHAYREAMRSADVRLQSLCAQWLAMHQAFALGRPGFVHWAAQARDVSRHDDVGLEPRLDLADSALAMLGLEGGTGMDAARRALSSGRDLGLEHVYSNALVVLTDLLLHTGALEEAAVVLREAQAFTSMRPSPWYGLEVKLLEAHLALREGRLVGALALLDEVSGHELAHQPVLRRDLAEARAWVALDRGRFGEARALAVEALSVDEELGERCAPLRPRLVELVATVAGGETVALGTIAALRAQARETELTTISQLAARWLYVDELTRGWSVDLHGLEPCEVIECRALDLEIEALSSRRWALLRDAAEVWSELGTTVWQARALLWHSELTRTRSPEADELLTVLQSPQGLAETLRAQVRGLRT